MWHFQCMGHSRVLLNIMSILTDLRRYLLMIKVYSEVVSLIPSTVMIFLIIISSLTHILPTQATTWPNEIQLWCGNQTRATHRDIKTKIEIVRYLNNNTIKHMNILLQDKLIIGQNSVGKGLRPIVVEANPSITTIHTERMVQKIYCPKTVISIKTTNQSVDL